MNTNHFHSHLLDGFFLFCTSVSAAHLANFFGVQWFQDYPEFLANPFYISGESYAGIYVPTLSRNVANGKPDLSIVTHFLVCNAL
jgi:hypothetical protein